MIKFAYRGEFCYLKRDLLPDESEIHTCEILHEPGVKRERRSCLQSLEFWSYSALWLPAI